MNCLGVCDWGGGNCVDKCLYGLLLSCVLLVSRGDTQLVQFDPQTGALYYEEKRGYDLFRTDVSVEYKPIVAAINAMSKIKVSLLLCFFSSSIFCLGRKFPKSLAGCIILMLKEVSSAMLAPRG